MSNEFLDGTADFPDPQDLGTCPCGAPNADEIPTNNMFFGEPANYQLGNVLGRVEVDERTSQVSHMACMLMMSTHMEFTPKGAVEAAWDMFQRVQNIVEDEDKQEEKALTDIIDNLTLTPKEQVKDLLSRLDQAETVDEQDDAAEEI